jgi:hypothetical protein
MPFCNACGATLDLQAKFCNRCGGPGVAAVSAPPSIQFTIPDASRQGKSLSKILLTVMLLFLGLGFAGMAVAGFVRVLNVVRQTHVRQEGDKMKIESPFGTVESMDDPEKLAHELGITIYPGARPLKSGTATVTFGDIHSATMNFESSDPAETVANFYKSGLPNVTAAEKHTDDSYTVVSRNSKRIVTVNIKAQSGRTLILISHVTRSAHPPAPASN